VLKEAGFGDPEAAARRLAVLSPLTLLEPNEDEAEFAQTLIQKVPFPPKATADAFHIAVSVLSGMDFLLTWNCTHIANATFRHHIQNVCESKGFEAPTICTPEELLIK
jgi:hypothetical protein